MFRTYVTGYQQIPLLAVGRSARHAEQQIRSLLRSRGYDVPDDFEFVWKDFPCDQPGAYTIDVSRLVGKVPEKSKEKDNGKKG